MTAATERIRAALAYRYVIERELGQGGMATVYLAADLKHDRNVAIKVLKPELAAVLGAERFVVEIKTTAALSHPHILPLFDSGETAGFLYYVMPYIEGETIREKLNRETQFGVDEAVRITREVADALDYAHRHGVIHRDIKPENILLHDGRPMVMDFGIALAVSAAAGGRMTETGLSLGTPHYMSPEQATADKDITGRSDIYSLASVLYEMLTGNPPHTGSSAQQIIMKIIAEPTQPVTAFRKSVPPHVAAAIGKALEKLPADRFASAHLFSEALVNSDFRTVAVPAPSSPSGFRVLGLPRAVWFALAGVIVGAAATYLLRGTTSSASDAPAVRGSVDVSQGPPLALVAPTVLGYSRPVVAVSPDGSTLVYVVQTSAGSLLQSRDLATGEVRALLGTEGAIYPFFSPDGAWIGFLTNEHVKKLPREGGTVTTLCAATIPVYARWLPSNEVYFTENETTAISKVSSDGGGASQRIAERDALGVTRITDVMPDGMLLAQSATTSYGGDYTDVVIVDVGSRQKTLVAHGGYAARYVAPGYVIFARGGSIMAVAVNSRGTPRGEPVAIASNVSQESLFGILHAAASDNGVLAFIPGGDLSVGKPAWVDRAGGIEFVDAPERVYGALDLSPDGQQIAVQVMDVIDYLWIWSIARREGKRLLSPVAEGRPTFSPRGDRLGAYVIGDTSHAIVHEVAASGRIGDGAIVPGPWLGLAGFTALADTLVVSTGVTSVAFVGRDAKELAPRLSGSFVSFAPGSSRWLSFLMAARSGSREVYIASFPELRVIGQVSTGGGSEPRWHPSGELYFRRGQDFFATRVETKPEPHWDPPRKVFASDFIDTPGWSYDVSPDGERLLVVKRVKSPNTTRIDVITNWTKLMDRGSGAQSK